jgi:hypothetical protein
MDIIEATKSFESWLKAQLATKEGIDTTALKLKHEAMKSEGGHAFLRATFYRWVQLWQTQGIDAPQVLSVGDTHVENFGTGATLKGDWCGAQTTSTRSASSLTPATSCGWASVFDLL